MNHKTVLMLHSVDTLLQSFQEKQLLFVFLVSVEVSVSSILSDFPLALENKHGGPNEHVSLTRNFASRQSSFVRMLLSVAECLLSEIVLYSNIA
jgi:hypothetical protein